MPGSVSARLSVWFRHSSARRNEAASAARTSRPPGSCSRSAASPRTRWSAARRFVPASVMVSVPAEKSNAARPILPGGLAPAGFQCRRPAIMRCSTRKRSEEHTSELQSQSNLVCRLLLEKKKKKNVCDVEEVFLRDRTHLSQDVLVLAILGIRPTSVEVFAGREIVSICFVLYWVHQSLLQ